MARKMSFKQAARACKVKASKRASKKFWNCVNRKRKGKR